MELKQAEKQTSIWLPSALAVLIPPLLAISFLLQKCNPWNVAKFPDLNPIPIGFPEKRGNIRLLVFWAMNRCDATAETVFFFMLLFHDLSSYKVIFSSMLITDNI